MSREKTTSLPEFDLPRASACPMGPRTAFLVAAIALTVLCGVATALDAGGSTQSRSVPQPQDEIVVIPHPHIGLGDIRSETVAAAARLVGLTNSFTPDSFAAHILFVTGLSDKDSLPAKTWAGELSRRLKRLGALETNANPRPGDLVFFSLQGGLPHSSKATRQSMGVVEKVSQDRVTFIAAGPERIIRGTLALKGGKVKETRLISCDVKEKAPPAKQTAGKKGKSAGKNGKKNKKASAAAAAKSKKVACTASDLLVGFADIETVAAKLAGSPPERPRITVVDGTPGASKNLDEPPGQLGKKD